MFKIGSLVKLGQGAVLKIVSISPSQLVGDSTAFYNTVDVKTGEKDTWRRFYLDEANTMDYMRYMRKDE